MRVGYLIPEFPGQTHIFFWREMQALRALGAEVETISTRRPPAGIVCHEWSRRAIETTHYLFPPRPGRLLSSGVRVGLAGPSTWSRCASAIGSVEGVSARARARMVALALVGRQLADVAAERGIDHVHVHSCGDSALIATFARVIAGLPYSLTLHGPIKHYGPAQGLKWGHAKFGVAVTNRLRHEVLATVDTVGEDRVEVAPMGVDVGVFRRSGAYAPSPGGRRTRVVTCGRLHEHKGHQDLIGAIDILVRRGVDAELRVLGEGPARSMLEHEIARRGLDDRVTLLGAVAEEVVREELEASDVFALASHDEAIGVATMEAMSMGLPVVVTDVGGVGELVEDGESGLLVPALDPPAMADAMARLDADPALCARMSANARRTIEDRFDSRIGARILFDRIAAPADAAGAARARAA